MVSVQAGYFVLFLRGSFRGSGQKGKQRLGKLKSWEELPLVLWVSLMADSPRHLKGNRPSADCLMTFPATGRRWPLAVLLMTEHGECPQLRYPLVASSCVLPCDIQPGSCKHSATVYPSSPWRNTTVNSTSCLGIAERREYAHEFFDRNTRAGTMVQ
jgi:hypothetical protein